MDISSAQNPNFLPPAQSPLGRPTLTTFVPEEPKTHNLLTPLETRIHQQSYPVAKKPDHDLLPPVFTKPQYVAPPHAAKIVISEPDKNLNRVNSAPDYSTKLKTEPLLHHPFLNYFLPLDSVFNNPYGDTKRRIAIIVIKSIGLLLLVAVIFDLAVNFNALNKFVFIDLIVLASLSGIFLSVGEHMDALKPVQHPYHHIVG